MTSEKDKLEGEKPVDGNGDTRAGSAEGEATLHERKPDGPQPPAMETPETAHPEALNPREVITEGVLLPAEPRYEEPVEAPEPSITLHAIDPTEPDPWETAPAGPITAEDRIARADPDAEAARYEIGPIEPWPSAIEEAAPGPTPSSRNIGPAAALPAEPEVGESGPDHDVLEAPEGAHPIEAWRDDAEDATDEPIDADGDKAVESETSPAIPELADDCPEPVEAREQSTDEPLTAPLSAAPDEAAEVEPQPNQTAPSVTATDDGSHAAEQVDEPASFAQPLADLTPHEQEVVEPERAHADGEPPIQHKEAVAAPLEPEPREPVEEPTTARPSEAPATEPEARTQPEPDAPSERAHEPVHQRIPAVLPHSTLRPADSPARAVPLFEPRPAPAERPRAPDLAAVSAAVDTYVPDAHAEARTESAPGGWKLPSQQEARPLLRRIFRALVMAGIGLLAFWLVLIVAYRWINPPASTLMLGQWLTGTTISKRWVPIERISPYLQRAVITSEDGRFCYHHGVDWSEISEAIERARDGIPRGGSTISMQVVKNLFLWPSKSYVRKALEIPLTYAIELAWPKKRILEIYLNIAEWGPGVFGAEAAARHHFGRPASGLTSGQAALLAASLPNPIERRAGSPGSGVSRIAARIHARMLASPGNASCVGATTRR